LKFEQPPVVAVVQLQRPIEMGEGEGKGLDLFVDSFSSKQHLKKFEENIFIIYKKEKSFLMYFLDNTRTDNLAKPKILSTWAQEINIKT